MVHYINPEEKLTLEKIQEIIDKKMTLALSDEAKRRIEKCRNFLKTVSSRDPQVIQISCRRCLLISFV